jgi:hypothetical protein
MLLQRTWFVGGRAAELEKTSSIGCAGVARPSEGKGSRRLRGLGSPEREGTRGWCGDVPKEVGRLTRACLATEWRGSRPAAEARSRSRGAEGAEPAATSSPSSCTTYTSTATTAVRGCNRAEGRAEDGAARRGRRLGLANRGVECRQTTGGRGELESRGAAGYTTATASATAGTRHPEAGARLCLAEAWTRSAEGQASAWRLALAEDARTVQWT